MVNVAMILDMIIQLCSIVNICSLNLWLHAREVHMLRMLRLFRLMEKKIQKMSLTFSLTYIGHFCFGTHNCFLVIEEEITAVVVVCINVLSLNNYN
jgi:hypothetical protein